MLLEQQRCRAWVLYKLDGGIDHILIDEAQDTSPEQWAIVRKLTEEFFAGEARARTASRTIFAVGDEKQSIFSFQGADPSPVRHQPPPFRTRWQRKPNSPSSTSRCSPRAVPRRKFCNSWTRSFGREAARAGLTSRGQTITHLRPSRRGQGRRRILAGAVAAARRCRRPTITAGGCASRPGSPVALLAQRGRRHRSQDWLDQRRALARP